MTGRDYTDYINDIIESIDDVASFVKGMSYDEFVHDKKTFNAVVRSIEIIGEAAGKLPQDVRHRAPDIPWNKVTGMRNRLAHEYFGIDAQILWKTAVEALPPLREKVQRLKK